MRKVTTKKIYEWFRTLEENKFGRIAYKPIDARRVAYFINHGLAAPLPESLKRKEGVTKYLKERKLAAKYIKEFLQDEPDTDTLQEAVNEDSYFNVSLENNHLYLMPSNTVHIKDSRELIKIIAKWFKEEDIKIKLKQIEMDGYEISIDKDFTNIDLINLIVEFKSHNFKIKRINKNEYKVTL